MQRRNFLKSSFAVGALSTRVGIAAVAAHSHVGLAAIVNASNGVTRSRRRVAVSMFGSDDRALQRAIDTSAAEVLVDIDVTVAADVRLRANQTLRFRGGKLIVAARASIKEAVLVANRSDKVVLVNPLIDAGARNDGVAAIRLVDCTGARISGGRLIRANLRIESYDNTIDRSTDVTGLTIDMRGFSSTAVYLNGVRGVTVRNVECFGGHEGIGIYNNARAILHSGVASHHHRQDGFLVNAGQDIRYENCRAHDNGQSGFTTQRQTGGEDSRNAVWDSCQAWGNAYDGFDIRGANNVPWGIDTGFVLRGCTARSNRESGFYIVFAEGTTLISCVAALNRKQNLFVDGSDRVVVDRFRSSSGAGDVPVGPNKAGILIYNSNFVQVLSATSENSLGSTQYFGLSFTGASRGARVVGGNLSGNRESFFAGGNNVSVTKADK